MEENVVLTLSDNNKYVVAKVINYNNKEYFYLVDINNNYNFMFCEHHENKVKKVLDLNIIKELLEFIS